MFGGVGQCVCQIAAALITGIWYADSGANGEPQGAPCPKPPAGASCKLNAAPRRACRLADANAWALTVVLCLFEVFFELSICTLSWVS